MAVTKLIRKKNTPTGRRLDLIGSQLVVATACCNAELKQEGGAWLCRRCNEIDAPALWAAIVNLEDEKIERLSSYHWDEWFKFWFDLEDVTIDVSWW